MCPFQSHVRRANPRSTREDIAHRAPDHATRHVLRPTPSMRKNGDAERGLVFMAYNASIAEQFEVIQAWLSGGNSSGPKTLLGAARSVPRRAAGRRPA